ncbi:MAG: hypothetical protein JRN19_02450 [Nitrososphaerota archaeon]|nr:hypothetical protein [Nitrososphaerota archaeon]MDG7051295.1 hypothetical protein [Nitrososphaerota archaeon]
MSANLNANQTIFVPSVLPADILTMIYNDSLSMPLEFNLNGMSVQSVNDTYFGEY